MTVYTHPSDWIPYETVDREYLLRLKKRSDSIDYSILGFISFMDYAMSLSGLHTRSVIAKSLGVSIRTFNDYCKYPPSSSQCKRIHDIIMKYVNDQLSNDKAW